MFHFYLVVPALAILAFIGPAWGSEVQRLVECLVLALAIFALLWSFRIPGEITSAHVRQLQSAISHQRDAEHDEIRRSNVPDDGDDEAGGAQ